MLKKRVHFFEIEDLASCPRVIRDGITDILQFSINLGRYYVPIIPRLTRALRASNTTRIVDLCSGAGGPWPSLFQELNGESGQGVSVLLTDLYPNEGAFARIGELLGEGLEYRAASVSAFDVPAEIRGFRTIFTGFHHFRPQHAQQILLDAVRKKEGIGVFEFTHRSMGGILPVLFAPLGTLLVAPLVKPFRWSRIVFTYLIPVLPLCTLFDGVVSCLRTYSVEELQALVDGLPENNHHWEIGEEKGPMGRITFLLAYPRADSGRERA